MRARRSLQLQEQIRQLTEKKYELQQEEERSKQSPEEQREQLMAKIKRDNNEVEQVGVQCSKRSACSCSRSVAAAVHANTPASCNAAEWHYEDTKFGAISSVRHGG